MLVAQVKGVGLIYICITLFLLTACASGSRFTAPIADSAPIPSHKISTYVVSKGDTLYSIAWRLNMDYKALARANGLPGDYRIYPGQELSLDLSKPPRPSVKVAPAPKSVPKAEPKVVAKEPPPVSQPVTVRSNNKSVESKNTPAPVAQTGTLKWVWPATGAVVATFSDTGGLNKGIDIRGDLGEPVMAAADGVVVYSGSGLRGYGKLLIVKHSEKVLSAYAHNRVLHVAEGDRVTAGQKIAQIGHTGTQSAKLHFEIRFDGTPVDPLKYLPKR